ncbi:hypothetical protein J6I92_08155 [Pseudidiomarina sp. 1APR75-15]|uniref:Uncharacterized protein n=1 Tax=Pseudidiomarina terrestris TaxID=2820060 RepID=A0ABT8MIS0_9GAMM|nr:CFI-box-CTERM domain-containing protein [Pseudidiomarina sp. 1APR75-15]MDN7129842.1 hypothetical protein [Pseudidiomarina sp. 1APR75-15]
MDDDKKNTSSNTNKESGSIRANDERRSVSLIHQAMSNLSESDTNRLMSKAAEEALRLEVKQREIDIEYSHARKSIEDHVQTFNRLDKQGRLTRQKVTTDLSSGGSNMRIESKSGAACFVATAAYQNPNHPDVIYLRSFRDKKLATTRVGRSFIAWYWRNGPKLAKVVRKSPVFAAMAKAPIFILVRFLQKFYR